MAASGGVGSFNASVLALGNLFYALVDGKMLHMNVPYYQRAYVWDAQRAVDLFQNIFRQCEGARQPPPPYFIGAIVLAPANTAQIHDIPQAVKANVNPPVSFHVVVDGQQRLTTLILIISSLRTINQHNCDADHNKWEGPRKANENLLNKFLVSKETDMSTGSDVYLQRFSVKNENTARWQPFVNPKKAFHQDNFADGHHVRSSQFFLNFDALT